MKVKIRETLGTIGGKQGYIVGHLADAPNIYLVLVGTELKYLTKGSFMDYNSDGENTGMWVCTSEGVRNNGLVASCDFRFAFDPRRQTAHCPVCGATMSYVTAGKSVSELLQQGREKEKTPEEKPNE